MFELILNEIEDARSDWENERGKDPTYIVLGPERHEALKFAIRKIRRATRDDWPKRHSHLRDDRCARCT